MSGAGRVSALRLGLGPTFGKPCVDATVPIFRQAKGRACRRISKQAFQSQSLLALLQLLERDHGGVVCCQSQKVALQTIEVGTVHASKEVFGSRCEGVAGPLTCQLVDHRAKVAVTDA